MDSGILDLFFRFSPSLLLMSEYVFFNYISRDNIKKSNYKIYKNGLGDDVLITAILEKKSLRDIVYLRSILGKYPDELKEIYNKFVNYVSFRNLDNCLVNLNNVIVDSKFNMKEILKNIITFNFITGYYNPYNNKIKRISMSNHVLSHEFLHMASTAYWNRALCGFNVLSFDEEDNFIGKFGTGLNEGYTELLNSRIFYDGGKPKSYETNVRIVRLIECFFDDYRDMEYAYFHSDVSKVYEQVCRYATRCEYFSIINSLDVFAKAHLPIDIIDSLKVEFKLYDIIKRSKDRIKIANFERVFFESHLVRFIINHNIKLNELESFDKVKKLER